MALRQEPSGGQTRFCPLSRLLSCQRPETPANMKSTMGCQAATNARLTAFFTFLRANLALNPSTISQANTPILEPATTPFPSYPPSPTSRASTPPLVPIDDIPELSLEVLHDEPSKDEALQLVADSVSQQRHQAALSLATHPICVSGLIGSLALTFRYLHPAGRSLAALATCAALLAAYAVAVRYLTAGYRRLAADVPGKYAPSRATDTILGARLDGQVVAALILRLEPGATAGRRRGKHASLKGGKGVIRAWTTAAPHRGEG
ncbi:hypothetical protein IMZ48_38985, partial [Candidatus Bathyarchaeota archaeon]|nr:hypothetical protein [Candidatus Bathyarchaeota archaeon]